MTTNTRTLWTQEHCDEAGVLLVATRAALDTFIDVVDGDEGPRPNWAMSLTNECNMAIQALGRYHSQHTGDRERGVIEATVQQTITLIEEIDTEDYPKLAVLVEQATRIGDMLAGKVAA